MPEGPLYSDQSPQGAGSAAQSSFPNSAPSPTTPCIPNPGGTPAPAGPAWKVDEIVDAVKKCDGGTNMYGKAKAANNGNDPTVKTGSSAIGSGGHTDLSKGEIVLDTTYDKCYTLDTMMIELSNLSHKDDFNKVDAGCPAGDLSREEYIKANEKAEYDGVKDAIKAFDACKNQWGCKTSSFEWARGAKNFDDYYKMLGNDHKEHYGKFWDANCKAAYDAKHPPAPPPSTGKSSSTCFIATAAYGSAITPEVQFLRELRDNVLRRTNWGASFFERYWKHYYEFSPALAARMEADPDFRKLVRWSIVTPWMNYLRLLVARPPEWRLEALDPELRSFLESMRRDMESWLREIDLPEDFAGRTAEEAVSELNIALGLVLKERVKIDEYLAGLAAGGNLPLRFTRRQEPLLLELLLDAGRSLEEISRILYGVTGDGPARERIRLALPKRSPEP